MTATLDRLTMKVALPDELDDVLAVLNSAAAWLSIKDVSQWPDRFERGDRRVDRLIRHIQDHETYLLRHDDDPVGTVTVTEWQDPEFADAWPDRLAALYVVRLAVSREGRAKVGAPLGALLLQHASILAARCGWEAVRLDCSKTNERLHRYYEEQGFTRVATVDLPHRKSGALYEKRVTRFMPPGVAPA